MREVNLRLAEHRVVGGDGQVAEHRELAAPAQAVALHRRDHRLAQRPGRHQAPHADAQSLVVLQGVMPPRHLAGVVAVRTDVESDAKAPSFRPQHDDARVGRLIGLAQHPLHLQPELHAERVELGRAVQRDDADLAVGLVKHLLFGHSPPEVTHTELRASIMHSFDPAARHGSRRRTGICTTWQVLMGGGALGGPGNDAALRQESGDIAVGHRPSQQVALPLVASVSPGSVKLLLGLNALDDRGDPQALRKPDHSAHDGLAILPQQHVLNEAPVDLDLVEREVPQVSQGRIARTKVIQRYSNADGAQLLKDCQNIRFIVQQHRLGDFQIKPTGRQPGGRQRAHRQLDEVPISELSCRQVHRDTYGLRPFCGVRARRTQNPLAHRQYESGLFSQWNKFDRRNLPVLRMIPSEQCLESDDLLGVEGQDRLVVNLELTVLDRLSQIQLEQVARLQALVHFLFKEAMNAPTMPFGEIQCHIRVLQ